MNKVYDYVTERILKMLESGTIPWHKPWLSNPAINYVTRKPYRGINVFLLDKGGEYLSFKQIKASGGCIKKGAKAEMVVFYKIIDKKTNDAEENDDSQGKDKKYFILRYYNVFHISDVEGIESKLEVIKNNPIEEAEKIINGYNDCPPIKHNNSNKAYYSPLYDYINTPEIACYPKVEEYYSVLFHEAAHSTGHISRLNRQGVSDTAAAFGSETYSKEELVAEFAAAMLCGIAGIENKTIENSAAYIKGWSKKIQEDKTLVVKAATQAQKACDYILSTNEKEHEGNE